MQYDNMQDMVEEHNIMIFFILAMVTIFNGAYL